MLSKRECENILGKTIRNDTYAILTLVYEGKTYQEAYNIVDKQRAKYRVDKHIQLAREVTIKKYIPKIRKYLENKQIPKPHGIYGIYLDNRLIYIGLTMTSFEQRYKEHKSQISLRQNSSHMVLYQCLARAQQEGKVIELRPLISNTDLNTTEELSRRDWENIELGLITLYKPVCNQKGRTLPYTFSVGTKRAY